MRRKNEGKDRNGIPSPAAFKSSFKAGAIALVFLFLGFELALFVREAAVDIIVAHRDAPDTVFVYRTDAVVEPPGAEAPLAPDIKDNVSKGASAAGTAPTSQDRSEAAAGTAQMVTRKDAGHTRKAASLYEQKRGRRVENFRFDPNTVSATELQRLGFSEKQAAAILSYRAKGGRFHRKEDFERSYVVADTVYARLEAFIDIPLLDINAADSASFDALPGIGGWFASRMVEYRERIGGYSDTEQLLEIYNFGVERYDGLKDLIFVGPKP